MRDTIAAIATATGGGVGMVRLSGPQALAVAGRVFRPMNPAKSPETMPGYTGAFGRVCHGEQLLDEAVLFVYHAPHSYTGEDVAEFCCHGGEFVLSQVLAAVIAAGARPAEAGEYTRRALMNGRMTLTEAESVIDILAAQNIQSLRAALGAMEGALHREVLAAADTLTDCCAHISAWIDYPEEDVEEVSPPVLLARLNRVEATLFRLEHSWQQGQMVRQGIATAIIGSANVGKSTLFNALAGENISIVKDTPGITRDRIYADIHWLDMTFTLIDTGGIEPDSKDVILSQMREQAEIAMETADVIIFLVDVKQGLVDADSKVADMLRRSKKPVILVVNKVDSFEKFMPDVYEFYNLGIGDPHPVSASSMLGLGDMLDEVVKHFPEDAAGIEEDERPKIAIIGKPNVGKSSLINKLAQEDRVIVSDIAGTTRDAIDTDIKYNGKEYVFIDTAGLRRKNKIKEEIERYSIIRAVTAVERADVVIIVIDAIEGVTEQDAKIAGIAHDRGKGIIIAVNKWDAIEKDNSTVKKYTERIRQVLSFMPYAEILFISAKSGQRLNKIFEMIDVVIENNSMRVATGVLNEIVAEAVAMQQPPSDKGKRLKIYYVTQVSVKPPTFVVFVNDKNLMHFSYTRYLENRIRDTFGFQGTALKFITRERKED